MKINKKTIIAVVSSVFSLAAALGSNILTPEQREAVLQILTTLLAVFGL